MSCRLEKEKVFYPCNIATGLMDGNDEEGKNNRIHYKYNDDDAHKTSKQSNSMIARPSVCGREQDLAES